MVLQSFVCWFAHSHLSPYSLYCGITQICFRAIWIFQRKSDKVSMKSAFLHGHRTVSFTPLWESGHCHVEQEKVQFSLSSSFSLKLLWGFSSSVIYDGTLRRFYSCLLSKEAILLFFSLLIHPLMYFLAVFPCAGTDVCPALCWAALGAKVEEINFILLQNLFGAPC